MGLGKLGKGRFCVSVSWGGAGGGGAEMLMLSSELYKLFGVTVSDIARWVDPENPRTVRNALRRKTKPGRKARERWASNLNQWRVEHWGEPESPDEGEAFQEGVFDFKDGKRPHNQNFKRYRKIFPALDKCKTLQAILAHENFWWDCYWLVYNDSRDFPDPPFPKEILAAGLWDNLFEAKRLGKKCPVPLAFIETVIDELLYIVAKGETEYNEYGGQSRRMLSQLLPQWQDERLIMPMDRFIALFKGKIGAETDDEFADAIYSSGYGSDDEPLTAEAVRKWRQGARLPDAGNLEALRRLATSDGEEYQLDFFFCYRFTVFFQRLYKELEKSKLTVESIQYLFSRYDKWFQWHTEEGNGA